jgi:hypothetical protein
MGSPIGLFVIALTISSLSAFASRILSLRGYHDQTYSPTCVCMERDWPGLSWWEYGEQGDTHCLIHLLGRKLAMYLLHRLAGLLHRQERFLVDIGRLDGIYLLLQRPDLRLGLLEAVLVLLLTFQGSLRGCHVEGARLARAAMQAPVCLDRVFLTILVVCGDVFPGQLILLIHLVLEVPLALLQHVKLRPQPEDGVLRGILLLLSRGPAEPAQAPARHVALLIYR